MKKIIYVLFLVIFITGCTYSQDSNSDRIQISKNVLIEMLLNKRLIKPFNDDTSGFVFKTKNQEPFYFDTSYIHLIYTRDFSIWQISQVNDYRKSLLIISKKNDILKVIETNNINLNPEIKVLHNDDSHFLVSLSECSRFNFNYTYLIIHYHKINNEVIICRLLQSNTYYESNEYEKIEIISAIRKEKEIEIKCKYSKEIEKNLSNENLIICFKNNHFYLKEKIINKFAFENI